jgi:predicted Zn finger-like uncharacterized protein
MIVACPNCTTRLQLEDAKVPARPFTVRCPKCQQIINAQPPSINGGGGALSAGGDLPASSRAQREVKTAPATAAAPFNGEPAAEEANGFVQATAAVDPSEDLARLLSALLKRGGVGEQAPSSAAAQASRRATERRRALVCVGAEPQRVAAANGLISGNYEVFVASDMTQAIERMREEKMSVVVLDSEFDALEQGAAFINREISALRPADRRRVVFVNLSPTARTADAHAAFLANVNLVVNNADAAELPQLLERCIRSMNDLYGNLNKVLNVAEL